MNSQANEDMGKLILRLLVGGLILFHGVAKIMKPGTVEYIGSLLSGYGIPGIAAYAVYIGEVIAPLMIIVGFYCRLGALLVAITMIVAILLMHTGDIFSLTEHGGWRLELQAFYLFGAVAIMQLGPGQYSAHQN